MDNALQVHAERQSVPFIWGEAVYSITGFGLLITRIIYGADGADGITLSADGDMLYWTAIGSRYPYSVPTTILRDDSPTAELLAQASIVSHAVIGISDSLDTDSNERVYTGDFEQNAINIFDPASGMTRVFVRDPRIGWTDSMFVATHGYIYFTENQLWRTPGDFSGTECKSKTICVVQSEVT